MHTFLSVKGKYGDMSESRYLNRYSGKKSHEGCLRTPTVQWIYAHLVKAVGLILPHFSYYEASKRTNPRKKIEY
jgi:hypothetical protein